LFIALTKTGAWDNGTLDTQWTLLATHLVLLFFVNALPKQINILIRRANSRYDGFAVLSGVNVRLVILRLVTLFAKACSLTLDERTVGTDTLAGGGIAERLGGGSALLATRLAWHVIVEIHLARDAAFQSLGAIVLRVVASWALFRLVRTSRAEVAERTWVTSVFID